MLVHILDDLVRTQRGKIIHEYNLDYFLRASPHLLSLKYGMVLYGLVWSGVV
jgi:hypothetical protein